MHGSVVTTNLNTGGTLTNVFISNRGDHIITDNADGTITITVFASAPNDDVDVPDSFRVVRSSTGNSDLSNRDFCADLVQVTS